MATTPGWIYLDDGLISISDLTIHRDLVEANPHATFLPPLEPRSITVSGYWDNAGSDFAYWVRALWARAKRKRVRRMHSAYRARRGRRW